ncbi:PREDICTED: thylakoid lumenal 15.0 kDa protein 2, chloroplastic isoform X3 [Ipomoea nil]|uniref:thylakoid lumenal 15.0 kDa protein 2, chloroplastic isoform X3 n=1 Tax=Ipomoea nil TaxID=35883 RepID=UPI0009008D46|nr:PREDICTED: thylakoid lumenal 15.0 kDa protein 2, chloroplastic isoform X3 [Ipomoea nil]
MASSHLLLPPLCISLSAPDHSHSSSPRKALLSHSKHKQAIQTQKKPIKVNAGLQSKTVNFLLSGSLALALSFSGVGFAEGKVGVNKPEMLPKEFTTVIDVAGFLSDGQEKRLAQEIADIEKDTGFKLRVLAQNYPETPGLAIKDFWEVDDRTIVFVADPTFGNILNFNVGASVDLDIPRSFWSRLAGKYGNIFYWKEKGEDASIESAVMAISACLREPVGANNCSEIGVTFKSLHKFSLVI